MITPAVKPRQILGQQSTCLDLPLGSCSMSSSTFSPQRCLQRQEDAGLCQAAFVCCFTQLCAKGRAGHGRIPGAVFVTKTLMTWT